MKTQPKNRVTITFQPTDKVQKLLTLCDKAGANRSELINALLEQHLPALLRQKVAAMEETLQEIKKMGLA